MSSAIARSPPMLLAHCHAAARPPPVARLPGESEPRRPSFLTPTWAPPLAGSTPPPPAPTRSGDARARPLARSPTEGCGGGVAANDYSKAGGGKGALGSEGSHPFTMRELLGKLKEDSETAADSSAGSPYRFVLIRVLLISSHVLDNRSLWWLLFILTGSGTHLRAPSSSALLDCSHSDGFLHARARGISRGHEGCGIGAAGDTGGCGIRGGAAPRQDGSAPPEGAVVPEVQAPMEGMTARSARLPRDAIYAILTTRGVSERLKSLANHSRGCSRFAEWRQETRKSRLGAYLIFATLLHILKALFHFLLFHLYVILYVVRTVHDF